MQNTQKSANKKRSSYSKTDHDTTFMRVKTDYMGNDHMICSRQA